MVLLEESAPSPVQTQMQMQQQGTYACNCTVRACYKQRGQVELLQVGDLAAGARGRELSRAEQRRADTKAEQIEYTNATRHTDSWGSLVSGVQTVEKTLSLSGCQCYSPQGCLRRPSPGLSPMPTTATVTMSPDTTLSTPGTQGVGGPQSYG